MKCPLRDRLKYSDEGLGSFEKKDCLEEECAWWDKGFNRCVMQGYLHELVNLADELAEIRDKLPGRERLV